VHPREGNFHLEAVEGWACRRANEADRGGLIYFRHNLLRMTDKMCELFWKIDIVKQQNAKI